MNAVTAIGGGGASALMPNTQLPVPQDISAGIKRMIGEAATDVAQFRREHGAKSSWQISNWALLNMGWPPDAEGTKVELARLHKIADQRTPEGIAAARWYAKHGLTDGWEQLLKQYTRLVGPRQARAAERLLHDTLGMVNSVTQTAKSAALRDRPFVVDPNFPLAVDKPGNSPSYPSGHASSAWAAAIVLAYLMPDRKAEFFNIATQASYARLYGGVHFPSDVMAGVKLSATVAMYNVQTTDAVQRRGTKNSGVAGRRLPNAAKLHGKRVA